WLAQECEKGARITNVPGLDQTRMPMCQHRDHRLPPSEAGNCGKGRLVDDLHAAGANILRAGKDAIALAIPEALPDRFWSKRATSALGRIPARKVSRRLLP